MVNIRVIDQPKGSGSPRGEVGEIDTRAPFQSVKAAVSLFGEVALSKEKRAVRKSKLSSENVLDKETQLLLAQREVGKFTHKFQISETMKARALSELERAKKTMQELNTKLKTVTDSKQTAIEAAEAIKKRAKELEVARSQNQLGNAAQKQELDQARQQYKVTARELNCAKQELNTIRQDFDAALDSKSASFQQAAEAQRSANVNMQKANELSKEIAAMRESHQQLKTASAQAQEQQAKILMEKDARIQACKTGKEEVVKKLEALKKEYDPQLPGMLEAKLAETTADIEVLQQEMEKAHTLEMEAMQVVTTELKEATKTLEQVAEEEKSLRDLINSLRQEVENVKREQSELLEKEADREAVARRKAEEKLLAEAETARREAEEMKKNAEELKREAENARLKTKEAEKKLEHFLREADEAKAAEKIAHDQMKNLSETSKDVQNPENNNKIKITLGEFESLKKKLEECDNMAEAKEMEAMAEVEAINARKNEAEKKLEATLIAIEEIKEATEMALKSAEMAEAAQSVVEGELRRWREREQNTTT